MSTVYNLEPQPTAKVLLKTTLGDLEIELWAKQVPKASRNFLQLCLDGYYNNTVFHRLVPGFIIQGGDPTGTGQGGESSYDGEPFEDEFHSRLKFNRRGLLGMANTGKKDDNGSQFFFTLGNTPELQNKNTLFGRIAGDTIYNLMKMAESDIAEDSEDRPVYTTKITGTEILLNPFDDMKMRVQVAERTVEEKKPVKKAKRKAGKAMLSFGGDEEEGVDVKPIKKKPKFNAAFVSAGEESPSILNNTPLPQAQALPVRKQTRKPSRSPPPKPAPKPIPKSPPRQKQRTPTPSTPSSREASPEPTKQTLLDRTNAQIAALKQSMKRNTGGQSAAPEKKKSALENMIPATSTRGRRRGAANTNKDQDALDLLAAFRSKLEAVPAETAKTMSPPVLLGNAQPNDDDDEPVGNGAKSAAAADEEEAACDLHFIVGCQSCKAWDKQDEQDSDDDTGWMSHALTFEKDRLGKDLEWKRRNEEELLVIDPREKARGLAEERKNKREKDGKGKGKAWDGRR